MGRDDHGGQGDRTGTVVPDVLGRTVDVARQTLEAAGYAVEVRLSCPHGTTTCTGSVDRPGVVWQQAPDVGARVPLHSRTVVWAYPA